MTRICAKCKLPITSKYIKAFDQAFHIECFTCVKCGKNVSDRFFHMNQQSFCEQDYFKEKGLICTQCNQLIKTSHVTFNQQKYHLHCFTCAICKAPFDKQASYFTVKQSELLQVLQKASTDTSPNMCVVCKYHYSTHFAMKCVGCILPILNQFVETSSSQCWHPECYMLFKTWNVLFFPRTRTPLTADIAGLPIEELPAYLGYLSNSLLPKQQVLQMYSKVQDSISLLWHTLTQFEESLTNTIGELLQNFTALNYTTGLEQAALFVNHVEVLFECLDKFNRQKLGSIVMDEQKECKFLAKKMIHFFTLLSHTQQDIIKKIGATQELLSLVTSMAQYLKVLIRTCVVMALLVEHKGMNAITELTDIWTDFILNQGIQQTPAPVYVAPLPASTMQLLKKDYLPMDRLHVDLHADLCTLCRQTIDDDAIVDNLIGFRWHSKCFPMDKKSREIIESTWKGQNKNLNFDDVKSFGYTKITKLGQYVFLLRVALRRLHNIMSTQQQLTSNPNSEGNGDTEVTASVVRRVSQKFKKSMSTNDFEDTEEIRTRSPSINNLGGILKKSPSKKNISNHSPAPQQTVQNGTTTTNDVDDTSEELLSNSTNVANSRRMVGGNKRISIANNQDDSHRYSQVVTRYSSELSALEHIIVQHFAVLMISPLVDVSKQELLEAIGSRKEALLSKLVKQVKKTRGLFATPLELLTQKGIDSNLGAGPGRLRIPVFVDSTIKILKSKNLYAEGIFRLNGNIKKIKDSCDLLDIKVEDEILENESEIQLAAILKKFLRDLPEPLMTFKLYKLFVSATSNAN
eukprot:NODE_480_length_7860_cov_0.165958.p1 type:complete len:801 gc:universal NODE_480_length_7860_cov_0.165958:4188-1786(-)